MDFTDLVLSGTHRRYGVVLMKGPDIKKGHLLQDAQIIDLAPTILALLDIPIPADMDGNVLLDALISDDFQVHYGDNDLTGRNESGFSDAEAQNISRRLRQLGYL